MKKTTSTKLMLTLTCFVALLCFFVLVAHAEIVDSGICGVIDNDKGFDGSQVMWMLDEDGTLTISGTGAMKDYGVNDRNNEYPAPWSGSSVNRIVICEGVTAISTYAFSGNNIKSITIPDSVTIIKSYAFHGCKNLRDLKIPDNVISIRGNAFSDCTELTNVTIGKGVTNFGANVFSNCSSLCDITIPDNVTSIGEGAFLNCTSLVSVTIGKGLQSIGRKAFSGCISLSRININSISSWCGISFGSNPLSYAHHLFCNGIEVTDLVIPDGVTVIKTIAFEDCTELTTVTIPDSVTSIGSGAFRCCTSLKSVKIGDGLTDVGSNVFDQCDNLTTLTIGNAVSYLRALAIPKNTLEYVNFTDGLTKFKETALSGYKFIKEYNVSETNTTYSSENGILYNKKKTSLIRYPSCKEGETFNIPTTVKRIAAYAFRDNQHLKSITIPNWVNKLGSDCFSYCLKLQTAVFGTGTKEIPSRFFYYCTALTDVTIPYGIETIGSESFYGCAKLTKITIANDIQIIKSNAFSSSGIKDIYFSGTADDWVAIGIQSGNEKLIGARKHFGVVLTPHKKGDVDGDGKLTSADARLALRASVGLTEKGDVTPGSAGYLAADVNGDGKVGSDDARLILRASVGLEDAGKFGKKA